MSHKDSLCLGDLMLVCSIIISSGFTYWLYKDTDMEKFLNFKKQSWRLIFHEQYEEELKLRSKILNDIYSDEIDPIWIPFVQDLPNGYSKLEMYIGLLAGDVEREASYAEIADAIDTFPEGLHINDKYSYLKTLEEIKDVRQDFLAKYKLLNVEDSNSEYKSEPLIK